MLVKNRAFRAARETKTKTKPPAAGWARTKKSPNVHVQAFYLVELQGLEPWTSSMPWKRSSQLSYSPMQALPRLSYHHYLRYYHTLLLTECNSNLVQ
jgi:hypothetical protein